MSLPAARHEVECAACEAGQYREAHLCLNCPPGKHGNGAVGEACAECAAGTLSLLDLLVQKYKYCRASMGMALSVSPAQNALQVPSNLCVCVTEREKERGRDRKRDRESREWCCRGGVRRMRCRYFQFTCFTRTKVQILTGKNGNGAVGEPCAECAASAVEFVCV